MIPILYEHKIGTWKHLICMSFSFCQSNITICCQPNAVALDNESISRR